MLRVVSGLWALLAACSSIETPPLPPPAGDAAVTVGREKIYLHNAQIVRTFALRQGAPRTVSVAGRLAGGADLLLDGPEFVITLGGGRRLTDSDFAVREWSHASPSRGPAVLRTAFHRDDPGLAVEVVYELAAGKGVIRKRLKLTADGVSPVLIDRIELEHFKFARPPRGHEGPGQPVYAGDLFWGCEYPAAENIVRDGVVSLGYLSGVELRQQSMVTRAAIVGAGHGGHVRDSFFDYLEDVRSVRRRPLLTNSTRFDVSPFDEDQAKKSISGFSKKLVQEYGTPYQSFVLDEGWDAAGDPWGPDPARFPAGLGPLRKELEGSGASLGVRMTAGAAASRRCIADEKTRRRLVERAAALMRDDSVNYLRLDGFADPCSDAAHGHRVGPYAAAAAADAVLEALAEIRRARPDVFILLGDGFWLSPWWLVEADALWRGDADYGFAAGLPGAPRRERWITFVDAVLHRELVRRGCQVPLSALSTGAIIQGRLGNDLPESQGTVGERDEHFQTWEHMVALECARGTRAGDLHMSYAVTTRDQWTALARWLRWTRERADVLARGEMTGGDPAKGEPYAFVHALPDRAIVAARNPSDAEKDLILKTGDSPLPFPRGKVLLWKTVYPEPEEGQAASGEPWGLRLRPFEVRVVEVRVKDAIP